MERAVQPSNMIPAPKKLFVLLRAPDGQDIAAFQDCIASALAGSGPWDAAIVLSLCRISPAPAGLPRRPDDPADPRPPYDVAIRADFANEQDARSAFAVLSKGEGLPKVAILHVFQVAEIPVLKRLAPGQKSEVKNLALIVFHDDMPDSAAQRSWAQHAKIAQVIHTGAGRYYRNWVVARSEGAPHVRGIVEIDFATLPDLVDRYFGVPDGMARVIQDTGHFVQKAQRLYMHEQILR